ncbi:MAG: GNAT family N-acetyltransferase [Acidimicrobiia bacterium]
MLARRRATPTDVGPITDHFALPAVYRYLWDGEAPATHVVAGLLERSDRDFAEHGYGLWVLTDPACPDAAVVGVVVLHEVDGHPGRVELTYSLDPAYQGRGLMTTAAAEVLAHGFDRCGLTKILAGTDPPNVASQRVLGRLGMRSIGELVIGTEEPVALPYWSVDRAGLRAATGR